MRSRTFADFAASALRLDVDEASIRYLSPQALIELKSGSDRDKDRLDVAALRAILAGTALPDAVDLVRLTPPANKNPEGEQ